ncbi:hypothetical protein Salat_2600700 [Sesamum alatum]|uniref:Uncharacterized protein n=1 Tax=Sesamum alatum TaxID=300844 RepID=A0AAE1XN26_9LAMI|nr:hypothetical protein Salat_2600700 [Sesamum alatum]
MKVTLHLWRLYRILKRRWNEKFGEFQPGRQWLLRPSSSCTLHSFPADYGSYSACTSYSTHANDRTNECVSTTHSYGGRIISGSSSLIAAVVHGFLDFSNECCGCNPSAAIIVIVLEGSQQDPDNQPPSLTCGQSTAILLTVETSPFKSDSPSIGVDNSRNLPYMARSPLPKQPQYSFHT